MQGNEKQDTNGLNVTSTNHHTIVVILGRRRFLSEVETYTTLSGGAKA